jgi:hypothetical protein
MKLFLSFIIISLCINSYSQNYEQVISKTEMYSDFDSLIVIIKNANPHLKIYKNLLGVDVLDNIKNLRNGIDTVNSLASYYLLVARAMRTIPEGHTRMLKNREIAKGSNWYKNRYPEYFDSTSISKNKKIYMDLYRNYASYEKKSRKERLKYEIPLTYVNGQFYSLLNIEIENRTKNTVDTIDTGDRLIMINNITVDSFLVKYNNYYSYAFNINKWDNENQLFYNEQLLKNDSLFGKDLTLTFYSNRLKKIYTVYIVKNRNHIFKSYFHKYTLGPTNKYSKLKNKVMYFDSTLFIKIPKMNYSDTNYYKNELLKYKNKPISKVIIDVRNNGGGSDYLWEYILSLISDSTLCRHQRLGINNWKPLSRFVGEDIDSLSLYFDPILKQNFRLLAKDSHCYRILPDTNSIRYHGNIYLLHNRESFSSATAFVTFALGSDRVIAVGESNGYLGGYGTDPFLFQLPYSKLMFIMHSTIHIPVNATCYYDYFWNKTEINVTLTPSFETLMYDYSDYDIYTIDFLKKKDLYFIKAIQD